MSFSKYQFSGMIKINEYFRFLCVNCPCYSVCGSCEDKMEEHNDKHIFRVLGIEFKLEEEQPVRHKGIISRLFKAVSKKKSQLLKGNTEVKEE